MIKYFRKIRQKLLSDNLFRKYLLYAIGEIILLIVGILVALSTNTWNLNNRELELYHISNLVGDLEKDWV